MTHDHDDMLELDNEIRCGSHTLFPRYCRFNIYGMGAQNIETFITELRFDYRVNRSIKFAAVIMFTHKLDGKHHLLFKFGDDITISL